MDILQKIKKEKNDILVKSMEIGKKRNALVMAVMQMEIFDVNEAAAMLNEANELTEKMRCLSDAIGILCRLTEDD